MPETFFETLIDKNTLDSAVSLIQEQENNLDAIVANELQSRLKGEFLLSNEESKSRPEFIQLKTEYANIIEQRKRRLDKIFASFDFA